MVAFGFIGSSFNLPDGWHKSGSLPDKYDMGIAPREGREGKNAATIKSTEKKIDGFGTLMQKCKADKYQGKRIKMSGYVKAENIKEWAGLWFRVDGKGSGNVLAFDNMETRAIKGNKDWQQYYIVLDVPKEAVSLAYGALMYGTGQIWFENIEFTEVALTTPATGEKH